MPGTIAYVMPRGGFWFAASATFYELERLGVQVDAYVDGDPAAFVPGRWVMLRGSAGWHPKTMRLLASLPRADQPPVLLWLTEPLPPPEDSGFEVSRRTPRDLAKLVLRDPRANDQRTNLKHTLAFVRTAASSVVAVSTLAKVELLAALGVESTFVPYGAAPVDHDLSSVERDVDVLFVGDPAVPHRQRALRALRKAGVEVGVRGAWSVERGLWGEEREAMLRRTKLLLNVSRHPGNAADARLALGAVHGAVVVSEPMYRPDPYLAGVHFEEAPLADLPDLIGALLNDEGRRVRLAAAAADVARITTTTASVGRLVELMG